MVLLVHVPVGFEEAYPLALAALAASLKARGHRVEGLDAARVGATGLRARLTRGDVEVVGISAWSPGALAVRAVVKLVRTCAPKVRVVLGGPHPTLKPGDIEADAVVQGEGEVSFPDLLDAWAAGRSGGGVLGVWTEAERVSSRPTPCDLGAIPPPDRLAFRVGDYHRDHNPRGRRYTATVTSRGCLHACAYCSAPSLWGRGHRYRPAEQVVAEWAQLRRDHDVGGLLVEDDLFTQRPARVEALCEALLASPPGVGWELINGIRPETVSPGLLQLMARAGCTRIAFAIETGDTGRLRALGRGDDPARVSRSVAAARAAGIGVTGYFMVGLPGESARERHRLFQYARGLGLDMAHFSLASAWPGTSWPEAPSPVSVAERAAMYGRWYLHPGRARRAAAMLGVGVKDLPRMGARLVDWMVRPLEARRAAIQ